MSHYLERRCREEALGRVVQPLEVPVSRRQQQERQGGAEPSLLSDTPSLVWPGLSCSLIAPSGPAAPPEALHVLPVFALVGGTSPAAPVTSRKDTAALTRGPITLVDASRVSYQYYDHEAGAVRFLQQELPEGETREQVDIQNDFL